MPLLVELLESPSEQDRQDLDKLAAETASGAWGVEPGALHFAGRFNGRVLALAVMLPTPGEWQLQRMAVRALTRRRGMARRMLEVIDAQAKAQGLRLGAQTPSCEEHEFFLVSMGFRPCAEGRWQRP